MEYAGLVYNFIVGIVSLCGGLLFTWWWIVIGKASDVYHYTTAVLYGIVVSCIVNIMVLHLIFHTNTGSDPLLAKEFAQKWWFVFRSAPEHLAVACIVIAMVKRTIKILKNSRRTKNPLPDKTYMEVVSSLRPDQNPDPYSDPHDEVGKK